VLRLLDWDDHFYMLMEHMGRRGLYGSARVSSARPLGRHLVSFYIQSGIHPREVLVKGGGERTIKDGADL
jgi:hypothetical protein